MLFRSAIDKSVFSVDPSMGYDDTSDDGETDDDDISSKSQDERDERDIHKMKHHHSLCKQ